MTESRFAGQVNAGEMESIGQEIRSGIYGKENRELFDELDSRRQDKLCYYICKMIHSHANVMLYSRCVTDLLEKGIVYFHIAKPETLLIYVGCSKNTRDSRLLTLIDHMLLPLPYNTQIFWEHHFGVIGRAETLQYGAVQII